MNIEMIFSVIFGILTIMVKAETVPTVSFGDPAKPHIVFLISEDENNYEAHLTIPPFAKQLEKEYGLKATVILGKGERTGFKYPGLHKIKNADLLVVFSRRVALKPDQMNMIKEYLEAGKPLVGIRTANHAFSVREEIKDGYIDWKEFVPEILGCENRGYGPVGPGTDVEVNVEQDDHAIIQGYKTREWHSDGNVYLVAPLLDPNIKVLLEGTSDGKQEPIAWTRKTKNNGKVFYTSLGHPSDFKKPEFITLLINGINWAINE